MVLHRPDVVSHVEVGVAELAVYGREGAEVVGAGLQGGLEEGDAVPAVAALAQLLALECQLETRIVVASAANILACARPVGIHGPFQDM